MSRNVTYFSLASGTNPVYRDGRVTVQVGGITTLSKSLDPTLSYLNNTPISGIPSPSNDIYWGGVAPSGY